MKKTLFLIYLLTFSSCNLKKKPKDVEANKYYSDFVEIYNKYPESTNEEALKAIDSYNEKYPNTYQGYLFKGFVLGQMGAYSRADTAFEKAKKIKPEGVEPYEYQSAFFLFDTTQINSSFRAIQEGMRISDTSVVLYNNLAWYYLLTKQKKRAEETCAKAWKIDSTNTNLVRTYYISANLNNDKKIKEKLTPIAQKMGLKTASLDTIKNTKEMYNLLQNLKDEARKY